MKTMADDEKRLTPEGNNVNIMVVTEPIHSTSSSHSRYDATSSSFGAIRLTKDEAGKYAYILDFGGK